MLVKDSNSISLVDQWYSICHKQTRLVDDSPSNYPNDEGFVEHRHDQSVFSILRKMNGSLILDDETYFEDWDENREFPIHTKRLRS